MKDRPLSSSEKDLIQEVDSEEEDDFVSSRLLWMHIWDAVCNWIWCCDCLLCVNYSYSSGGALRSKINIHHVPDVSVDPDYIAAQDPATEVHLEDDIIGHPAYIVYKMSLQQLICHLELPEEMCTVFNPNTMAKCGTPKPFDVHITSRGYDSHNWIGEFSLLS